MTRSALLQSNMESTRNIVICCDGTNNQFGPENTNVVRLVQVLERQSRADAQYRQASICGRPLH